MLLKPLMNKVIIKPAETSRKTESGIYVEASSVKMTPFAVIVAIGPHVDGKVLKIGAKVMYDSKDPIQVEMDDVKMFLIDDHEIIALIEEVE